MGREGFRWVGSGGGTGGDAVGAIGGEVPAFVRFLQTFVYQWKTVSALSDLFPKARAEVLRLLFETGDQEIHLPTRPAAVSVRRRGLAPLV